MKKSILKLGKALDKAEQKEINGGGAFSGVCSSNDHCIDGLICECGDCINPRLPYIACL